MADIKAFIIAQVFDEDDKERFWVRGDDERVYEFAKSLLYSGTEEPERVEVYDPTHQRTVRFMRDGGYGDVVFEWHDGEAEPCEAYCVSFSGGRGVGGWHSNYGPIVQGVVPASEYVDKRRAPATTSDGYHTVADLYNHRTQLFAALCRVIAREHRDLTFRAWRHHDGTGYEGWFIAGVYVPGLGWATYHCEAGTWDDFAGVPVLDRAPEWDGHTPEDVLVRLANI